MEIELLHFRGFLTSLTLTRVGERVGVYTVDASGAVRSDNSRHEPSSETYVTI
jgi:hypothetical protein